MKMKKRKRRKKKKKRTNKIFVIQDDNRLKLQFMTITPSEHQEITLHGKTWLSEKNYSRDQKSRINT